MPRIHCPHPLHTGQRLVLPDASARHVQVLRLQPGDPLCLFDGGTGIGGEFDAKVLRMGRSDVEVEVGAHHAVERESLHAVHLAVGMPANERMDWLVEKATELGVASIQPLMTERSVLRLSGDRAAKKQAHWQSVAEAACEQCGRNRVPPVHPVQTLQPWLQRPQLTGFERFVLSLQTVQAQGAASPGTALPSLFLSGPEGGLSAAEEALAVAQGFSPLSLGPRVLRAETAALAALVRFTLGG